ncbi:MAG: hypothetical protein ACP5JU_03225 [Minisyncoccia bacterium]
MNYFLEKTKDLLNIFYLLGMVGGILFLMYAGFKYITSGGKGGKGGEGSEIHKEILFAIIGLILIILSFTIPILFYSFLK